VRYDGDVRGTDDFKSLTAAAVPLLVHRVDQPVIDSREVGFVEHVAA
jgi:hypothetical protein